MFRLDDMLELIVCVCVDEYVDVDDVPVDVGIEGVIGVGVVGGEEGILVFPHVEVFI